MGTSRSEYAGWRVYAAMMDCVRPRTIGIAAAFSPEQLLLRNVTDGATFSTTEV